MARTAWNKGKGKTPGSGRKKGTKNKATLAREALLAEMKVDTTDPASFFMSLLKNPETRLDLKIMAAKELMPFAHPKLTSIEARAGTKSHEDRLEELQAMLAHAPKQLVAE
jgi:hypothetical protein